MAEEITLGASSAIADFKRARFRAKLERILARLTGKSADLLAYEDVRRKLKATTQISRGLQDIPIDAIVGSVDRYADFSRSFLPRQSSTRDRWAGIMEAMTGPTGVPPIEVYKVGEVYFVADGNHRVSVAKQLGAKHIQAYVKEVPTTVPLSPDVRPDDIILKAEQAEFLRRTRLDRSRPDADLSVSVPGQHEKLKEHISVHRYFMGIEEEREIAYEDAAIHWYDTVYLPIVDIIREQGILRDFDDRTEADLYLWIMDHRAELGKDVEWEVNPELAARDLVERYSPRPEHVVARTGERLVQAVVPEAIVPGPPPGVWRQEREMEDRQDRLFAHVVVTVTGREDGWCAVAQALEVSQREGARLTGLHIVNAEPELDSERVRATRAEFVRRCKEREIPYKWVVKSGSVAPTICEASRWASLTVVSLAHPPGDHPVDRLGSGFRALIQHCPTPILAVPPVPSSLGCALLAYNGSPKADEALYVATYLSRQWHIPLRVLTAGEKGQAATDALTRARQYLEAHDVQAAFHHVQGPAAAAILSTAEKHGCDLIVMGGYGFTPVLEIILGSTVDQVLQQHQHAVLICR
jgi:nucleotide-binding universal stress UspA family protein